MKKIIYISASLILVIGFASTYANRSLSGDELSYNEMASLYGTADCGCSTVTNEDCGDDYPWKDYTGAICYSESTKEDWQEEKYYENTKNTYDTCDSSGEKTCSTPDHVICLNAYGITSTVTTADKKCNSDKTACTENDSGKKCKTFTKGTASTTYDIQVDNQSCS